MLRPSLRFLVLWLCALVLGGAAGCGGDPGTADPQTPIAVAPPPAPVPAPKPRNAHLLAQAISGGKTTAILYVDKVRGHAAAPQIAQLPAFKELFDGTGVDPMRDLERAFVTATATNDEDHVIAVAEHNLDATRLDAAMTKLFERSDPAGQWVDNVGVRAAKVTIEGRTRIVALPTDKLIVVLPEGHGPQAAGFAESGGLPDPTGPEALIATALEPSKTVKVPKKLRIPETISRGEVRLVLEPHGGATVTGTGLSTDPEQAKKDAADITERIDNATTVKVSIVKVRVFKPVEFVANGSNVTSKVELSKEEVERLLGLAAAFVPR